MNLSALIIPFQLLLTGCDDEPEYDLSKIPVAEKAPEQKKIQPPQGQDNLQDEDAPLGEGVEDIANNKCAPPYEQTTKLTAENSVTATILWIPTHSVKN